MFPDSDSDSEVKFRSLLKEIAAYLNHKKGCGNCKICDKNWKIVLGTVGEDFQVVFYRENSELNFILNKHDNNKVEVFVDLINPCEYNFLEKFHSFFKEEKIRNKVTFQFNSLSMFSDFIYRHLLRED